MARDLITNELKYEFHDSTVGMERLHIPCYQEGESSKFLGALRQFGDEPMGDTARLKLTYYSYDVNPDEDYFPHLHLIIQDGTVTSELGISNGGDYISVSKSIKNSESEIKLNADNIYIRGNIVLDETVETESLSNNTLFAKNGNLYFFTQGKYKKLKFFYDE